jgi:hypothetical protein
MEKVINLQDKNLSGFHGRTTTDMAIEELRNAEKCREDRESRFDRSEISENEIQVYAQSIADEINLRAKAMPYQAFEIGKLLYDVKNLLPHGSFDEWISENLTLSKSTAGNYINIYKNCMGHPDIIKFFKLNVLTEICAPRFPEDLRNEIFNNMNGVFDINRKQLLELAFDFKEGKVDIDSQELHDLLKIEKSKAEYNRYKAYLISLKNMLKKKHKEFEELHKKVVPHPILKEEDNARDERYDKIEAMIIDFIIQTKRIINELRPEE